MLHERRVLNKTSFFESSVSAVLVDRLDSAGRDDESHRFLELRDVDLLALKVNVSAALASRVELGCTGSVRVAASDD